MKTKRNRDVHVCPACNSRDTWLEDSFKFEQRAGLLRQRCNNCGYVGPMTVMEKKRAERLKVLKVKKKNK